MWDHRFGGSGDDELRFIQETADGGFILGGYSHSGIGGDKTQPLQGIDDYWIVKTDSYGNKQWDRDFGGTDEDFLFSVQQTTDHGFILGGYSSSGISGDKTQASWGGTDYWIIKIDSLGNKQWDKSFGGTGYEYLYSLQQTDDGGFILGGYSNSGISGDKTQACSAGSGDVDYWIVKIDVLGNKQWDKDFGGSDFDHLCTVQQTSDHGFILGGSTSSGIGGDKTQPAWGGRDYWIIKTDSLGNKQWDKDFGGTGADALVSMSLASDGGFLLGGHSGSQVSGNKTQPTIGNTDYWIVRTDSLGTKLWDKDFGGYDIEDAEGSIFQMQDGGYLIGGDSFSGMGGDKSESNLGISQSWIIKMDSAGTKQWDKTILTMPDLKLFPYALQTLDGCYVVAQASKGGIAGDKSEANRDTSLASWDYWMIKFCDSTQDLMPTAIVGIIDPICPGTCIDIPNLSQNATNYQWVFLGGNPSTSTDPNPMGICYNTPGNYGILLIAANAYGTDTLMLASCVTVYPQPPPQGISQNGDTLFANAGAAGYQWYLGGNLIPGAINSFYVATQSGDYNVVAIDTNGCEVEAAIFNVIAQVPVPLSYEPVVSVFSTTSSVHVKIESPTRMSRITVVDVTGKMLLSQSTSDTQLEVSIGQLSAGLYFIHIQTESGLSIKSFEKK